jgi:hypothetical protein
VIAFVAVKILNVRQSRGSIDEHLEFQLETNSFGLPKPSIGRGFQFFIMCFCGDNPVTTKDSPVIATELDSHINSTSIGALIKTDGAKGIEPRTRETDLTITKWSDKTQIVDIVSIFQRSRIRNTEASKRCPP